MNRIFIHRWGSLSLSGSVVGEESIVASSSAAAQSASQGVVWTHVIVEILNDPHAIFGLSLGADTLPESGKIGSGLSVFSKAVVNQLETQLTSRGLKLERVTANTLLEIPQALVSFAKLKGANELHAIASRDPWSIEADTLLRSYASTGSGVSFVLHDEQFLIHPHTLASESVSGGGGGGGGVISNDAAESDSLVGNQLPASLRSLDGFCRLLTTAPELKRGDQIDSLSATTTLTNISASTALLEHFPAALVILSSPSASHLRSELASTDALVDDICKHRQAQGLSFLSATQALILGVAGLVYSRSFDPKTMSAACHSSIYLRQSASPPIIQSLIASGALHPRQLWIETSSLTITCRSLHQVYEEMKRTSSQLAPLFPPSTLLLLNFCLEYTLRLVRWISIREFASHVVYFKPTLAYSPARADLTPLPWAALPEKKPRTGQSALPSPVKASVSVKAPQSVPPPPASTSWWGSFVGSSETTSSVTDSNSAVSTNSSDWSVASLFGSVDDTGAFSKQLKALYDDVSGKKFADAFLLGQTGYPLIDGAMRSLQVTGYFPSILLPMIANFWCKHLGRPWHEGMRLLLLRSIDADVPLAILRWQWSCGFLGSIDWAISVDVVDVACGFDVDRSPPLAFPSWKSKLNLKEGEKADNNVSSGSITSDGNFPAVLYRFLKYPPHPHTMGHPSGLEFGAELDPCGLFVRSWLASPSSNSAFSISPLVPDAYIHEPISMPPALAEATGQTFSKPLSSSTSSHAVAGSLNKHVYATPVTSLAKARTNTIQCVLQLHNKLNKPTILSSVLKLTSSNSNLLAGVSRRSDVGALEHIDTTPVLAALKMSADRFSERQGRAGCESDWGLVSGAPLLVEEDGDVLLLNANAKKEDSWEELAIDATTETVIPPLRLVVSAQIRSDLPIRPHLANMSFLRHSDSIVHESVANLKKYGQWDLSFMRAEEIAQLDPFTQACYLIGDPPPPPFSYMFPQRDFVFFRHSIKQPGSGLGRIIIKTGGHVSRAPESIPNYKYVRAEVIGTVGFLTRPIALQPGCLSSTQPEMSADGALVQKTVPILVPKPVSVSFGGSSSDGSLCTPISEAYSPPGWILPPGDSAMTQIVLYSAGDPKGNIPSFIINAVAKRTPRKWADRLSKFCDKEIGFIQQ
jgi:hypothetical protein